MPEDALAVGSSRGNVKNAVTVVGHQGAAGDFGSLGWGHPEPFTILHDGNSVPVLKNQGGAVSGDLADLTRLVRKL